jgi:hypothetical protein
MTKLMEVKIMNLDDLTFGELKQINQMFSQSSMPSIPSIANHLIGKFVIVRTYSAGVHAGILSVHSGKECILKNAIRIHFWDGACSLNQLSLEGTKKPENCRFSVIIDEIYLSEIIEIIPCTSEAIENIKEVPTWKK